MSCSYEYCGAQALCEVCGRCPAHYNCACPVEGCFNYESCFICHQCPVHCSCSPVSRRLLTLSEAALQHRVIAGKRELRPRVKLHVAPRTVRFSRIGMALIGDWDGFSHPITATSDMPIRHYGWNRSARIIDWMTEEEVALYRAWLSMVRSTGVRWIGPSGVVQLEGRDETHAIPTLVDNGWIVVDTEDLPNLRRIEGRPRLCRGGVIPVRYTPPNGQYAEGIKPSRLVLVSTLNTGDKRKFVDRDCDSGAVLQRMLNTHWYSRGSGFATQISVPTEFKDDIGTVTIGAHSGLLSVSHKLWVAVDEELMSRRQRYGGPLLEAGHDAGCHLLSEDSFNALRDATPKGLRVLRMEQSVRVLGTESTGVKSGGFLPETRLFACLESALRLCRKGRYVIRLGDIRATAKCRIEDLVAWASRRIRPVHADGTGCYLGRNDGIQDGGGIEMPPLPPGKFLGRSITKVWGSWVTAKGCVCDFSENEGACYVTPRVDEGPGEGPGSKGDPRFDFKYSGTYV